MRTRINISSWLLSGVLALLAATSCRKTSPNEEIITASAGKNDTIYGNKAELNATNSYGEIVRFEWTQVSGPSTSIIDDPFASLTVVTNLQKGSYEFRLTVTARSGAKSSVTKKIDVVDPELAFENLTWDNDLINKIQSMKVPPLPNPYAINRIQQVYLFGGSWIPYPDNPGFDWFPIGKDGTQQNEYYYKIENDKIVVYEYYDVLPSNTFPNFPAVLVGNKVKLRFE
jgi:hypothetical protein